MTTQIDPAPQADVSCNNFTANVCAIIIAIALTLVIRGYQFGRSNHTVYLLDALRVNDPHLLSNDWYTTHTLQYHFVFTHVTAALDRAGILRPAFLIGYLAIVIFFQLGWFQINRILGGTRRTYLLSVLLYFLSAGGAGLGVFDFLQDSAFVPSNVSNIAMLWAIYFWITKRPARAGVLFGLAGFFHLNHALVSIALWGALVAWDRIYPSFSATSDGLDLTRRAAKPLDAKSLVIGTLAVLGMCLPNLVPAAMVSLSGPHKIPLKDFVDLYVHLRHPHHYDPLSWPMALWLSFLWPFPLAILAIRRLPRSATIRESCRVSIILCGMMFVALLFAGVWFVSEPLVQASLFRFSIYPKLFTCIGAAIYLYDRFQRPVLSYVCLACVAVAVVAFAAVHPTPSIVTTNLRPISLLLLFLTVAALSEMTEVAERANVSHALTLARAHAFYQSFLAAAFCLIVAFGRVKGQLGFSLFVGSDPTPDYRAVCDYAREKTPAYAIFLVPPEEQEFRLIARRAIVINFKGVAQLSSELGEWRDRLCRVLDVPTLSVLPRDFNQVFDDIAKRYEALPAGHLQAVAGQYHARYIVSTRPLDFPSPAQLVFERGRYHLYDLTP